VNDRFPGDPSPPAEVRFGVFDLSNDFVQGGPPPYAGTSTKPEISFGESPDAPTWFPRAAEKAARAFARKFPGGDEEMKKAGYTSSAAHRLSDSSSRLDRAP
jgi:hypothetical protein